MNVKPFAQRSAREYFTSPKNNIINRIMGRDSEMGTISVHAEPLVRFRIGNLAAFGRDN